MIYIALGTNLPNQAGQTPLQIAERALRRILDLPGLSAGIRSRWYSSAPIPPSGQPRFINGIVRAQGNVAADWLLARLQEIEAAEGRQRGEANAPRTLDLDIIDMHGLVRAAPDPILPHPRAHLRAFVLLPLRDVAPTWRHPLLGASAQELLATLPRQDIHPQ